LGEETNCEATVRLSIFVIASCWPAIADRAGATSTKEGTIRSLEEEERMAVLNEDVAALERLWSDHFIVNNPQNQISPDRNAVLDRVKRGLIRYSQFDRRIEAIRFNEDIAIVMGSESVVPKGDAANPPQAVHRRFTNIWRQSGTTWRMIARHATIVPGK
jgi:ketosteroid isomerase-like protein